MCDARRHDPLLMTRCCCPCPPLSTRPAGTVIPAQDSVYAAFNLAAFKQQRGGQGLFVVGPVSGQPLGATASVQLLDAGGASVAST
jgi:hypothetical protein